MAYHSNQIIERNSTLIPAGLSLVLTGLASAVHINFIGASWSLIWLPFIIVALWPRRTGIFASACLIFLAGLWVDWTTLGAIGQWPLVYLISYFGTRPDKPSMENGIIPAYRRLGLALIIGVPVYIATGWIVYGVFPDWYALFRGVAFAALILPIVALIRDNLAQRFGRDS